MNFVHLDLYHKEKGKIILDTHQSSLQLPQSLHRLRIIAWDLSHVIVFQSQHGLQHKTHLKPDAKTYLDPKQRPLLSIFFKPS